ncbi:MAG: hypothetical protein JNK57_12550 [Planctomycetaceae bacterium]|nr:hypothetical protein [Planctomycetaceae bacterium]
MFMCIRNLTLAVLILVCWVAHDSCWARAINQESHAGANEGWPSTGRAESGFPTYPVPMEGWQFRAANQEQSQAASVPAPWEDFLGTTFDGQGTYRLVFDARAAKQVAEWRAKHEAVVGPCELFMVFDGVATQATARLNGQVIGSHLGPWTPWSCVVDSQWVPESENVLEVEVDERVGHHTQGFLPVFLPHFGGIWQPVRWELRPTQRIEPGESLVLGDFASDGQHGLVIDLKLQAQVGQRLRLTVSAPRQLVEHQQAAGSKSVLPIWKSHPTAQHQSFEFKLDANQVTQGRWRTRIGVPEAVAWAPAEPWLYGVQVELLSVDEKVERPLHTTWFRTGFRRYETRGHQMLLNGDPVVIQGLLNWGYTPTSLAPTLNENIMLAELEAARRLGANLMKFCLWIPPKRYLELADECGVLTWIEYPTWHAQLIEANLPELSREYAEFTNFDRNHPSVILRSLTCETGSSAELSVIQHLYDLVHRQVPGAIVEDDSSWISWNRVSDIWDDHPYGNNHTWVKTLAGLREFIAARQARPLVLGEAIAADTWPDLRPLASAQAQFLEQHPLERRPFWSFGFFEAAQAFEQQLAEVAGPSTLARLRPDSVRYAYLMRKFQVETYRREVPWGGYVLSVIRDFPFAAMGLLDTFGQNKFPAWDLDKEFSVGPSMVLLRTDGDRRSWFGGDLAQVDFLLATTDELPMEPDAGVSATLQWELKAASVSESSAKVLARGEESWQLHRPAQITTTSADHPQYTVPLQFPAVDRLTEVVLHATVTYSLGDSPSKQQVSNNRWSLWLVPTLSTTAEPRVLYEIDSSLAEQPRTWLAHPQLQEVRGGAGLGDEGVIIASRFSLPLWEQLEAGAKVLMLPDGQSQSLPTNSHWFLRGGPLLFSHPVLGRDAEQQTLSQNAWRDLQHFDLAGPAQPQWDYWTECSPIMALWDNHDIKEVRVHGLVWEAKVGKGRLIVSMLNHGPQNSAIGPKLLLDLLGHLRSDFEPRAWSDELRARMREDLIGRDFNLVNADWQLRPDPNRVGFEAEWFNADLKTPTTAAAWSPIRIDAHWEGQDRPQLDGWAWYAADVQVPADWQGEAIYLCFTGVDDHYQAFVNGQLVGSAGVIETKETAFEMRTSHRLPDTIKAGDTLKIRIAVYDWYGAGGIFRPIYLRTTPWSDQRPMLKQ